MFVREVGLVKDFEMGCGTDKAGYVNALIGEISPVIEGAWRPGKGWFRQAAPEQELSPRFDRRLQWESCPEKNLGGQKDFSLSGHPDLFGGQDEFTVSAIIRGCIIESSGDNCLKPLSGRQAGKGIWLQVSIDTLYMGVADQEKQDNNQQVVEETDSC